MARNIQIIGSAFGPCDTDKTFSGVARHLFGVLKEKHVMVGYVNTKNLRFIDVLHGMIDFSKIRKYGHPGVSKAWLWKWDTVNRLSDRFNRCLDSMPDHNVVLQVGTHVHVQQANVKHYCFTDMTVAQAIYSPLAEGFNMTKLTTKQAVEAINVQKSIFQNCEAIFVDSNWVKNSIVADYGIARDLSLIHI